MAATDAAIETLLSDYAAAWAANDPQQIASFWDADSAAGQYRYGVCVLNQNSGLSSEPNMAIRPNGSPSILRSPALSNS